MSEQGDITEIKVSTARIEEQVKALTVTTALQHGHLSEQMAELARKEDIDNLDIRVAKLENVQSWVIRGVIGTALTAIAAVSGIGKKIGF